MKIEYNITPSFLRAIKELRDTLLERQVIYRNLQKDFYAEVQSNNLDIPELGRKFFSSTIIISTPHFVRYGWLNLKTKRVTRETEQFSLEKATEALKPHVLEATGDNDYICILRYNEPDMDKYEIPGICHVEKAPLVRKTFLREYINNARVTVWFSNVPYHYRLVSTVSENRIDQLSKILESKADKLVFEEAEINELILLGLKL